MRDGSALCEVSSGESEDVRSTEAQMRSSANGGRGGGSVSVDSGPRVEGGGVAPRHSSRSGAAPRSVSRSGNM